jgi:membrane-associated protein
MEYLMWLGDFIIHIDKHLDAIIGQYGSWTYLILFVIVFCETGLVVTPFLPGDSLLFAAGAFASRGSLDITTLILLILIAAIVGDAVNYTVGAFIGPKVFEYKNSRIFKKEYLEKTQAFYEKYGGKAIVFARFIPIIRTFAPFLAGVGKMSYPRFALFNVSGAAAWVGLFLIGGFIFGDIPVVRKNFTLVIFAIIFISILPAVIETWRAKRSGKRQSAAI